MKTETLYSITGLMMFENPETNEKKISLVENKSFRNIMSRLYNFVVENHEDDWDEIYDWIENEHEDVDLRTELKYDKPAENMLNFIVCRAFDDVGIE